MDVICERMIFHDWRLLKSDAWELCIMECWCYFKYIRHTRNMK